MRIRTFFFFFSTLRSSFFLHIYWCLNTRKHTKRWQRILFCSVNADSENKKRKRQKTHTSQNRPKKTTRQQLINVETIVAAATELNEFGQSKTELNTINIVQRARSDQINAAFERLELKATKTSEAGATITKTITEKMCPKGISIKWLLYPSISNVNQQPMIGSNWRGKLITIRNTRSSFV